jgi:A/G-specific adenine glycosylase
MAAVVVRGDKVLMAQRPASGLLGGLWEFPAVEVDTNSTQALVANLAMVYQLVVDPIAFFAQIQHAYTHFTLTEFVWQCALLEMGEPQSLKWVPYSDLQTFPMGKVDRSIASRL